MLRYLTAACLVALVGIGGPARADDDKELKDIVAKAIKAHGGAENLAKQKATVFQAKGKFYGMGDGIDYTGTWSIHTPDAIRVEIDIQVNGQPFKFIQVFHKDKGWVQIGDNVEEMGKDQLAITKDELHAHEIAGLVGLDGKDCKLSAVGEKKVNERPAIGVRVECKGYTDVTVYFDKENYHLVLMERRAKNAQSGQEFNGESYYDDYKKVDGVLMSYKQTIKRDGKLYVENEITELTTKDACWTTPSSKSPVSSVPTQLPPKAARLDVWRHSLRQGGMFFPRIPSVRMGGGPRHPPLLLSSGTLDALHFLVCR